MPFFQRLRADAYLAYRATIAHPLRRLFSQVDRTGRDRFLDNFAPEGLIPTSVDDRAVLLDASRCIQCGLCDAYSMATADAPGPSWLPIAWSRSTPDLRLVKDGFPRFDREHLKKVEAICPTRVPLRRIYDYAKAKLIELERYAPKIEVPSP